MTGFSQGVGTAFRSACSSPDRRVAVVALGGDVPPELDPKALARLPAVFIGRGAADPWYSQDKFESDVGRLRAAGVIVQTLVFDGGHHWTPEFSRAVGPFLGSLI
jgi:predicted esterase